MKLQKLLSLTRKAVDEFQLIDAGDKIAIGVSGGKDSLTMLYALHGLMRFYPNPFTLEAITVDLGHPGFQADKIKELCDSLNIPFTLVKTDIAPIIFQERKETNPCSLCAKMRKGALNTTAKELGCNKIALGHHGDDAIETLLLNMVHGSKIATFQPKQYMSRMDMFMIRPMIYLKEQEIIDICKNNEIPAVRRVCPNDGVTQRQEMKELLHQFYRKYPQTQDNFLHALSNLEQVSLWEKDKTGS